MTISTVWLALAMLAESSLGAEIQVTSLVDGAGDCSLEDAVVAANTDTAVDGCPAGAGADRVVLGPGLHVVSDRISITSEVAVEGFSAVASVVTDADDFLVFFVEAGGVATFRDLRVQDANDGAFFVSGSASLERVHVTNADANAIEMQDGAVVRVRDSTVEGTRGSAVFMLLGGSLDLVNSTLADNTSRGILAGFGGTVVVRHGTIVRNGASGVSTNGDEVSVTLVSSIVGDNGNSDVDSTEATVVSEGGNVLSDASAEDIAVASDQLDADLGLGGLAVASFDERPPVYTLLPTSAAVGAGDCLDLDGSPLTRDARGAPRVRCDAGAYERAGTVIEDEPAGTGCPAGGTRITVWDTTPPEVLLVCDEPGADPADVLVQSTRDASAPECPAAGVVVRWGADDNDDDVLQEDELDGTDVVCDGSADDEDHSNGCANAGAAPPTLLGLLGLLVVGRRKGSGSRTPNLRSA